jgi:hypothetical protein
LVLKVHQVHKDLLAHRDPEVTKDLRDNQDCQDHKELLVNLDLGVRQDLLDKPDLLDQQGLLVLLVELDKGESLVYKVLLDNQVLKDLEENQGFQAHRDNVVK